jgi:hypothetical protein
MKTAVATLVCLLVVVSGTPSTAAPIVFDNGGPLESGEGGNEATRWLQADDFSLLAPTLLTGGGVYLGFVDGLASWVPDRPFTYFLYEDVGGKPGTEMASGQAVIQGVDEDVLWLEETPAYRVDFDFATPILLDGGTPYWLGIHLAEDFSTKREIYWVTTAIGSGQTGRCLGDSPCGTWGDTLSEHAFYLEGTAIPEPASLALLGAGLLALTVARRQGRLP